MLHIAEQLQQKPCVYAANEAARNVAEALLKEVAMRGVLADIVPGKEAADLAPMTAAWLHLLIVWMACTVGGSHRPRRNSTGALSSARAQTQARRTSLLRSVAVSRVARLLAGRTVTSPASLAAFMDVVCATSDAVALTYDSVERVAGVRCILPESRPYLRGRLALAAALAHHGPRAADGVATRLRIPFEFVHAVCERQPGLLAECWPVAACLVPNFGAESHVDRAALSEAITCNFCGDAAAESVVDYVVTTMPQLRTDPTRLRDCVVLSQHAVSPRAFSARLHQRFSTASVGRAPRAVREQRGACHSVRGRSVAGACSRALGAADDDRRASLVAMARTATRFSPAAAAPATSARASSHASPRFCASHRRR